MNEEEEHCTCPACVLKRHTAVFIRAIAADEDHDALIRRAHKAALAVLLAFNRPGEATLIMHIDVASNDPRFGTVMSNNVEGVSDNEITRRLVSAAQALANNTDETIN